MLTDDKLSELEAAEAKATPGPWESGQWIKPDNGPEIFAITVPASGTPGWRPCVYSDRGDDSDTSFIALARNNLKALIDEVRELRLSNKILAQEAIQVDDLAMHNGGLEEEVDSLRAQLAVAVEALKLVIEPQFKNGRLLDDADAIEQVDEIAREALAKIGEIKNG